MYCDKKWKQQSNFKDLAIIRSQRVAAPQKSRIYLPMSEIMLNY